MDQVEENALQQLEMCIEYSRLVAFCQQFLYSDDAKNKLASLLDNHHKFDKEIKKTINMGFRLNRNICMECFDALKKECIYREMGILIIKLRTMLENEVDYRKCVKWIYIEAARLVKLNNLSCKEKNERDEYER